MNANQLQAAIASCNNTTDFFNGTCQALFTTGSNARQTPSIHMDNVAKSVCAKLEISDPNTVTQRQRDWCACYNAKVPENLTTVEKGIFQCINPTCRSSGLVPYGLQCPNSLTICSQIGLSTNLKSSSAGGVFYENNCGNVTVGGGGDKGDNSNRTMPVYNTSATMSKNTLITGVGIMLILLSITGILYMVRR